MTGASTGSNAFIAGLRRRVADNDPVALANFAWLAARHGECQIALDTIRIAVSLPGAHRNAWRALDRLNTNQSGDLLLTESVAGESEPTANGNPLGAAEVAHQHGELAIAEACYRAALNDVACAGAAWNGLAVLHEQRRERGAADSAWEHAISLQNAAGLHNSALAQLRRGFAGRARAAIAPALAGQPIRAVRFLAAYAALMEGDALAALPLLLDLVHEDANCARTQFSLGLVFERLGEPQEALAAIRRALLLSPWFHPQVWLLDAGPGCEPIELAADQSEPSPGAHTSDILLSLGRSLLHGANLGEALAVFDQVLKHEATQPAALFHRGVVLAKLRRYDEALQDWERVEQMEPTSELADVSRKHSRSARQLATLFPVR